MVFKYELTDKVLTALRLKAQRSQTTPEELLNQRLDEFCKSCACEHAQERRNKLISKIVELKPDQLEHVEQVVEQLLREVAG